MVKVKSFDYQRIVVVYRARARSMLLETSVMVEEATAVLSLSALGTVKGWPLKPTFYASDYNLLNKFLRRRVIPYEVFKPSSSSVRKESVTCQAR